MSLVIALIENSEVFLMADTQLTFPERIGVKPAYGMKVFFLDKHTAIAFAGTAGEIAHGRLNAIYKQGNRGDVLILAEQICNSFDHEVDFLLAQTLEKPTIVKVSSGSIYSTSGRGVYWIGDAEAAQFVAGGSTDSAYQLESRLREAIADPRFSTVGGLSVLARGKVDGFRYITRMLLTSPRYSPKEGEMHIVDFGAAHNGGFGYTTVVPKEPGKNGWGVFYFQGMYGEYWHTDFETGVSECLRAYAEKAEGFIELIQKETGIELEFCGSLG